MPKPQPLPTGSRAPVFPISIDGKTVQSDSLGQPCLVYFYPKDDTPGCTKQACGLRDAWSAFEKANLFVVGVSKDDETSHTRFREKYTLPFPLIADSDLQLAKAFGVYGEKKFMGKTYDGVHRMSFLLAEDGTILKTYQKIKPFEHAEAVLEDYRQLTQ